VTDRRNFFDEIPNECSVGGFARRCTGLERGAMGWRLDVHGLPDGYEVIEHEDGLRLLGPRGRVIAEFGPMVMSLGTVISAAWDDKQPARRGTLQPVG
jgi:hypothetical protein